MPVLLYRSQLRQYVRYQYRRMLFLDASKELLDVACWHPSTHGSHHRVPGTESTMPQQKPPDQSPRPCTVRVLEIPELFHQLDETKPVHPLMCQYRRWSHSPEL